MKSTWIKGIAAVAAIGSLAGCASLFYTAPTEQETLAVIKAGFADRSIAKVDRLNQSDLQKSCTQAANQPSAEVRARLEKAALAAVRYPADGRYMGDFKQGERIAEHQLHPIPLDLDPRHPHILAHQRNRTLQPCGPAL